MTRPVLYLCSLVFCAVLVLGSLDTGAEAQEKGGLYSTDPTASSWAKSKNARSRLLSAYLQADSKDLLGGVEITLRKNWKTYWRVPGEAGLPPRFDFSRSENLAKAEILWPAPNRYIDRLGVAIGYKDRVIFPIRITPKDPEKSVILKLKLDYAVCENICIPLTEDHSLSYKVGEKLEGRHNKAIEAFVDQVPKPMSHFKNLQILGVRTAGKKTEGYLVLDVKSRIGFRQPEIFVEGPEALYFRTPKLTGKPSVVSRWHVPISGNISKTPLVGETIKITFIDGQRRAETDYKIKR